MGLAVPRNPEEEAYYETLVQNYEHLWLPSVPTPSAERDRALRWLACVKLIYGETHLAKQACQQVLEGKSGTAEAAQAGALLARIQKAEHDVRGSFSAYRAALAAFPASAPPPDALVALLDAYGERGEWELAIQDVGPLIDAYCASANASALIWSDLYQALYVHTQDMVGRGEYAAARDLLRAGLALPSSWQERARGEIEVANTYMAEGNPEAAVALCEKVLAAYPGTVEAVEAQFAIAGCRAYQGRYAEARETLQKITDGHPGTPAAESAKGYLDSLPE